jgi:hypothetical protein
MMLKRSPSCEAAPVVDQSEEVSMDRLRSWFAPFMVMLLAGSLLLPVGALAQDASPIAGVCDAPALPPGTPTAMEAMGSPEAGMEMATPEGEMEMGTPEGEMGGEAAATPAMPTGEAADEATTERVVTAIANVIECNNSGMFLEFAALVTPRALAAEFGITNPYDAPAAMAGGPPLEILSIEDVQVHDDGRYSAAVTYTFSGIQIERERWFLVESGGYLLVDELLPLPAEVAENAVTIDAAMVDFAFELSQDTVPANTPLVFEVTNMGEYPHELVIVQLPDGATVEQALEGEIGFEDIFFVGATYSEGGQPAPDIVLTGLEPGTYTIVCFVDIPEGIPHAARGMVAELTVE